MFAAVGLCAPGSAAGRALRLMLTPKRGGGAGTGALGGPRWRFRRRGCEPCSQLNLGFPLSQPPFLPV